MKILKLVLYVIILFVVGVLLGNMVAIIGTWLGLSTIGCIALIMAIAVVGNILYNYKNWKENK